MPYTICVLGADPSNLHRPPELSLDCFLQSMNQVNSDWVSAWVSMDCKVMGIQKCKIQPPAQGLHSLRRIMRRSTSSQMISIWNSKWYYSCVLEEQSVKTKIGSPEIPGRLVGVNDNWDPGPRRPQAYPVKVVTPKDPAVPGLLF